MMSGIMSAEDKHGRVMYWSSADLDVHMYSRSYRSYQGCFDNREELWIHLCLEGGGRLVRKSTMQALEGLFLPGTIGIGAPNDGGEGEWPDMTLVALGIEPGRLAKLVEELPPDSFDVQEIASNFHRNALLGVVIRELWDRAGLHAFSTAFLDHALAVAIHQLVRSADGLRVSGSCHPLARSELQTVFDYVEAHLARDVDVARLARLVGMSPHHFSRRFRAATGLAPYQFLTQRRLDRAAELLTSSPLSVTDVGAMAGYTNPSHFSAAFRRYKGVTPLAWRQAR